MTKKTELHAAIEVDTIVLIDPETPIGDITRETARLANLGIRRLVFRSQQDHDQWRDRVLGLRKLLTRPQQMPEHGVSGQTQESCHTSPLTQARIPCNLTTLHS